MTNTIKFWPLSKRLIFPEAAKLSQKKDVGIALPGGGMKAAVLSIGWLQVFHELGHLDKVKYISSVSGGTWTASPMINSSTPIGTFLGASILPQKCTVANLENFARVAGSHAKVLTDAVFSKQILLDFFNNFFAKGLVSDFWSQTVGKCFFEPHNIKDSVGLNYRDGLPYLIVNGALQTNFKRGAVPVDFTPFYYGTPITHKQRFIEDFSTVIYRPIDAVFVEPSGFEAKVTKAEFNAKIAVQPTNPDQSYSIAGHSINELKTKEIAGISSAFFASSVGPSVPQFLYNAVNFPTYQFFSNGVQRFVDGGSSDVTGILALLRRGCTKIVAGIAADTAIDTPGVNHADVLVSAYGHYAGLFGVQTSEFWKVSKEQYNAQRKVFESSKWNEFLAGLKVERFQGKPVVHRMTLDVLPNALIGVTGGYKVDIIFATNEICTEFEDKLAVDTKTRLTEDRENKNTSQNLLVDYGLFPGDLRQFPFIDLKAQAYTPLLTGLLSQHAFYTLNEHKTAINSMFV